MVQTLAAIATVIGVIVAIVVGRSKLASFWKDLGGHRSPNSGESQPTPRPSPETTDGALFKEFGEFNEVVNYLQAVNFSSYWEASRATRLFDLELKWNVPDYEFIDGNLRRLLRVFLDRITAFRDKYELNKIIRYDHERLACIGPNAQLDERQQIARDLGEAAAGIREAHWAPDA